VATKSSLRIDRNHSRTSPERAADSSPGSAEPQRGNPGSPAKNRAANPAPRTPRRAPAAPTLSPATCLSQVDCPMALRTGSDDILSAPAASTAAPRAPCHPARSGPHTPCAVPRDHPPPRIGASVLRAPIVYRLRPPAPQHRSTAAPSAPCHPARRVTPRAVSPRAKWSAHSVCGAPRSPPALSTQRPPYWERRYPIGSGRASPPPRCGMQQA
jgi:hypothetical protein